MPVPLRFSFQGGGAKFVTLLAAASAIYDLEHDTESDLEIDQLSGTSAGAIAGGLLASGVNPEIIRQHLKNTGATSLEQVLRSKNKYIVAFRMIIQGHSLYEYSDLLEFIDNLLVAGAAPKDLLISETAHPVTIVTSDLYESKPNLYSSSQKDPKIKLSRAIANSCSLPFIFKSTRGANENHLVDGGIIENLPIKHLTKGFSKSQVVAFSFEDPAAPPNNTTLKSYALSLIDASISANIQNSSNLLPTENVILLPNSYSTLGFEEAIETGLDDHFNLVYQKVKREVSLIVDREKRLAYQAGKNSKLSRAINERKSANEIFEIVSKGHLPVENLEVSLTADSLRDPLDPQYSPYDTIQTTYSIQNQGDWEETLSFRVYISSNTDVIDFTLSEIEIFDSDGKGINFVPLVGEIEELEDSYSIPVYAFIRGSDINTSSITIRHTDLLEASLPTFKSPYKEQVDFEDIAMLCSYPEYGSVEWRIHLPDHLVPRVEFEQMTKLAEKLKVNRVVEGGLNTDLKGDPRCSMHFSTLQWKSNGAVQKGDLVGFRMKLTTA